MRTFGTGRLASQFAASGVLALGCISLAVAEAGNETVVVMRGNDAVPDATVTVDAGVMVMRPASGSFLRETRRLAARSEAREQQATAARTEAAIQSLARAIEAVERIAYAASSAPNRDHDLAYVWLAGPRPAPGPARASLPPVRAITPPR